MGHRHRPRDTDGRRLVQLAAHMRTALVADALQMANHTDHVAPGAIFHSDRGTQYTSAEFDAFTARRGMRRAACGVRRSLGRTGVCWDNAAAESFFAALKNEMYYRHATRDTSVLSQRFASNTF